MQSGMAAFGETRRLTRFLWWNGFFVVGLCAYPASAGLPDGWLDTPIKEFWAPGGNEFPNLCRLLGTPCGYEEALGKRIEQNKGPELHLKKTTARKILAEIINRYPNYQWTMQDGVLILEPIHRTGKDLLAQKIRYFSVKDTVSIQVAILLFYQAQIPGAGVPSSGDPQFACIDVSLRDVTVRQALNAIAKADGQVIWHFSPQHAGTTDMRLYLFPWRTTGGIRMTDKHNRFLPIGNPNYKGGCRELEM